MRNGHGRPGCAPSCCQNGARAGPILAETAPFAAAAYPTDCKKRAFEFPILVEYLQNLILGEEQPSTLGTRQALEALEAEVANLTALLSEKEFENFIDMIFVSDGWQRISEVGGQQAAIDGLYVHATSCVTTEIQTKSNTSWEQLNDSHLMQKAIRNHAWLYWAHNSAARNFEDRVATEFGEEVDDG